MKVVFLGVGEAFDERYPNHSHLVLSAKTALMLDCGDSAVRQLWKYTKDHSLVNALYITHRHSDHLFGIPALLGRMLEEGRKKNLTIICSEQLKSDVERLTEHAYFGINSYGFEITSLIQPAIFFISCSFIPLVVIAGVPILIPDGLNGGLGS